MKKLNYLKAFLFISALFITGIFLFQYKQASAHQHCYGPCVRKVIACGNGGTRCKTAGEQCGVKTDCMGEGSIE
jgi:hypothetical protein